MAWSYHRYSRTEWRNEEYDEEVEKETPKKFIDKKISVRKLESDDEDEEDASDEEDEEDDDDDEDDSADEDMGSADENEDSGGEEQEDEIGTSTFDPEILIKPNHTPVVVELYRNITRFFDPEYFRRYLNMNGDNDLGFYNYERFCYYQLFYLNKMKIDELMKLKTQLFDYAVGYMDFEDMCVGHLSKMCFSRDGMVIYLRPR